MRRCGSWSYHQGGIVTSASLWWWSRVRFRAVKHRAMIETQGSAFCGDDRAALSHEFRVETFKAQSYHRLRPRICPQTTPHTSNTKSLPDIPERNPKFSCSTYISPRVHRDNRTSIYTAKFLIFQASKERGLAFYH
ncbi:hypothetical protein SCLCIDRAFT_180450 [Scleroderma citrinum Foug A]|uniref:Uncharacterized protein n=1 Tax=Scleroderma citrinum Foug A TaxID=1036808 RepID=A0A0C3EG57_9AGAM|nr:hypothetical protein SCLCIDRAFT_180450 [Scleroderma citrinum Foug A]